MKITVLNGSPKGDTSVTMQYIRYTQKQHPDHTYYIDISRGIKVIEKDPKAFRAVLEDVRASELVIWAFPLYYFLVPSQYKRFIELVFEGKAAPAFRSKFAAVITTSIHFFDHTAHNYMRAICDDLAMKFAGSYSASMYDLVRSRERKRFDAFTTCMFDAVRDNTPAARAYYPVSARMSPYRPSPPKIRINPAGKNIVIITDAASPSSNLGKMAERPAGPLPRRRRYTTSTTSRSRGDAWGASSAPTTTGACTGTATTFTSSLKAGSRRRTSSFTAWRRGTGTFRPCGSGSSTGASTTITPPSSKESR